MSPANVVNVGPANPQTQSLLMQLPRELRNSIYASLFSSTRLTSGERYDRDSVIFRFIPAPHGLALLLSCRQAYIEIGKSWVSQVLFCFESGRAMVDKLGDIPLETRSMIRHIRVSADLLGIGYDGRYEQYDTHQVLKLLPGLKLDRLTVCSIMPPETSYNILSHLVEHSDGWKELCYKSHASDFLGYKLDWRNEERVRFWREPQPGGWQRKLEGRDGSDSEASVTIYQSNVPYMGDFEFEDDLPLLKEFEPHVSNTGTWVKFTQALAPNQDIKDYQKVADGRLMVYGEIGKEMLVVVKRGRGVDYEEKQGSPYIKAGDIRAAFPGKTWGEIKACDDRIEYILCQGISHDIDDRTEEYMDVMDVYTHVDDYVFPPLPEFRWMIG